MLGFSTADNRIYITDTLLKDAVPTVEIEEVMNARIWKLTVMTYFKVLHRHSPGVSE